ncbi:hypothetical protein V497_01469 [Pseudogymnoascus sp. VKM F-4516 (FW-969)]|nr:hypothetical protein V497_01469 [Pseudogymnoascus sp. VKM F-4516 (FW-969)]
MAGSRSKRTTALGSSSPRDQNSCPFEDFLHYLDSSLSRNVFLRLSEGIIKRMKAALTTLRTTGRKVDSDIVVRMVSVIDAFQDACSQLHSSAFVAIARILINAGNSQPRDRGLYLLAEFLHNGNNKEEESTEIQKSLSDVSKECLELIYTTFCDKGESYTTRRWAGLLVLELTSHSEDNAALIGFLPEEKRRKLGSQILYEENEILRTISGRVLTTLTDPDVLRKDCLFPSQTEKELIAKYPEQAPSASQWDKKFSSYIDDIWDKIADTENHGNIDFAQNLATIPEYRDTNAISKYHRSIYVVLSDCLYIYIHSGDKGFDTAIDIPFHSISGIRVEPTPLDGSVEVEPPADLIFNIKHTGGDQPCVNSSPSELSVVQLTFRDTAEATDIGNAIQHRISKLNSGNGDQDTAGGNEELSRHRDRSQSSMQTRPIKASQSDERLIIGGTKKNANTEATKKTSSIKASQSDERLVLGGRKKNSNTAAAEARISSAIHGKENGTEGSLDGSFSDASDEFLPTKRAKNTTCDYGDLYDASPVAYSHRRRSLIAADPVGNNHASQNHVLPEPVMAPSSKGQIEVGGLGKTIKSLRNAPTNVKTTNEGNEVSGLTINTSEEFGIYSPHINQSPSIALPGNPTDDALLPTQHDVSIDELCQAPPITVRPKKRRALKSKKPVSLSKKTVGKANTTSIPTEQQDKASEQKHPPARFDIIGKTVNTVHIAPEGVPKRQSDKAERSWSIEPDSPKLTALPKKKPVASGGGASKKRKTELDSPGPPRRGTRSNALPVKQMNNELADNMQSQIDVRPGPSNAANKSSSTKLARNMQVDDKEDSAIATVVIKKPKNGQKKPVPKSKAALKVKESAPKDVGIPHADIGGQHVDSDMIDHLQQHETFFEEAFQDYELPTMDNAPSFTPAPSVSTIKKMASKISNMFDFAGESNDGSAKKKLRRYGKEAKSATRATPKPSKPTPKGKGKETEEPISFSAHPEPKESPLTGKLPSSSLGQEIEPIYISSDEESEDPGDGELYEPQEIAQAAMMKLDKKAPLATEMKTESPFETLLEAPSELSPDDQSTPAMMQLSLPPSPAAVEPIKLPNAVEAAHLVDDHLARKTPTVAFSRNGPKNQGVSGALKSKPVEHTGSKTDVAKLVNAVALGAPKKRPSPEPAPHVEAPLPKRVKRVEVVADVVVKGDTFNDDIPNVLPHRLKPSSPVVPPQDSLLCSSQSRVDENGSPHARPAIMVEISDTAHIRRRTISISKKLLSINQKEATTADKGPFDDPDDYMRPDLDDEPTVIQSSDGPSANPKLQLIGREKEVTVNPRYLLSRTTTARKQVEAIPETDHATTVNSADPFEERQQQPRQLSNFAKRLKGEQPVRSKVTITTEAQPQPLPKAAHGQARKRSFVFEPEVRFDDPEKTLVDVENQMPWRRARSVSLGSSGSSSDTVDDKASVARSEELTHEMEWRRALGPPYRNLTETMICMVHTLVGDLVDKETAIDDIVDEYTRNGTRLVEDLERKASADRRELESQFSNTLQKVTRSFQQTRNVTISLDAEWENLDDLEAQWRKRQHELQDFMNEKIKCVADGSWKDQIKS